MRKVILSLLIFMITITMVTGVFASIPKPSVPEFAVKLVDSSYDIPESSSIDPYTGQTITIPSRHVDNRTLEFTIKNQPFTSYHDANSGRDIRLYYNIQMRGHFEEDWIGLYYSGDYPEHSGSEYTKISIPLGSQSSTPLQWLPSDSDVQVDFRVEACIGYFYRTIDFGEAWRFDGEKSNWSSTQTITIPKANHTVVTPSSSVPSSHNPPCEPLRPVVLGWVGVVVVSLLVVVVVLLVVLVFLYRRR